MERENKDLVVERDIFLYFKGTELSLAVLMCINVFA